MKNDFSSSKKHVIILFDEALHFKQTSENFVFPSMRFVVSLGDIIGPNRVVMDFNGCKDKCNVISNVK